MGSAGITILAFGGFPCLFPKQQGKVGQGRELKDARDFSSQKALSVMTSPSARRREFATSEIWRNDLLIISC